MSTPSRAGRVASRVLRTSATRRLGWSFWLMLGAVLFAGLGSYAVWASLSTCPGCPTADSHLHIAEGAQWLIPPGQYYEANFGGRTPMVLTGNFSASNGVSAFVIPQSELAQFENTRQVTSSVWSSGWVTQARIDVSLPAGTWTLLFANSGNSSTLITATSDWISA